jgi:hypothetical protein
MIKTKTVIIPAQKAREVEKEVYVCDICGKESSYMSKCVRCGRHICSGTFSKCYHSDPNEFGDYPDQYCPICYDLQFVKYKNDIKSIEITAESEVEKILQKIKAESLNTKI